MKRLLTVVGIIAILSIMWSFFMKGNAEELSVNSPNEITKIESVSHTAEEAPKKSGVVSGIETFMKYTGFTNFTIGHGAMIMIGLIFIFLAIKYDYEPLLLVPIGTGILIGNIPFVLDAGLQVGIYESGSVLNYLYFGVVKGIYPPLIFLGIGAMTDFSSL